jgi:hypothetical protein
MLLSIHVLKPMIGGYHMALTELPFTFVDYSGEKSVVTVRCAAIASDGGNWDDVVSDVAGSRALMGAALNTMTQCNETLSAVYVPYAVGSGTLPSEGADREIALRLIYEDDTTHQKYRMDIPGPIEGIWKTNSDELDLADVVVAAFVLVFEAHMLSPLGNSVTILSGHKVGRRN